jgi:predicted metal-dependent hydrolase
MRRVQYGRKWIPYSIQIKEGLKSHYISVDEKSGVILKGRKVPAEKADKLVLKKAGWILDKLAIVSNPKHGKIVTGSRIPYLGKSYYVQVIPKSGISKSTVEFTHSLFRIYTNPKTKQEDIELAIHDFYKEKAIEKIPPRLQKICLKTNLGHNGLHFRKMSKRWGSCTPQNKLIINPDAMKLPYTLIDYLLIHELCHTKVKDHSKAFYAELSKHVTNWKELDEKIGRYGSID